MAVDDPLTRMKNALLDALDQLCSPKSSSETKAGALQTLEKTLAMASLPNPEQASGNLDYFIALQYTFECNIPSRLLTWISTSTLKLEFLTNKGLMDDQREADALLLSSQLASALTLIQGIALQHTATKVWLGRKYPLEIILELLLASRHLSSIAVPNPGLSSDLHGRPITPSTPLSSVVLDTLLCILVDSPAALRVFEEVQGVNVVVRILKRAGTPRDVRMKCLEFLYFYLLDESPSASTIPITTPVSPRSPVHHALPIPQTPVRPPSKKPYANGFTPNLPSARQSSTSSLSPHTPSCSSSSSAFTGLSSVSNPPMSTSASSRSTSGSSSGSISSTSSVASSSTTASSVAPLSRNSSHEKVVTVHSRDPSTPPHSPPTRLSGLPTSSLRHSKTLGQLQVSTKSLLRKEVDYIPQTPKKPSLGSGERPRSIFETPMSASKSHYRQVGPSSERKLGHTRGKSLSSLSRTPSSKLSVQGQLEADDAENICRDLGPAFIPERDGNRVENGIKDKMRGELGFGSPRSERRRTTEEKKEYLGTMLGNVDALVEGVRRAGIWGLG